MAFASTMNLYHYPRNLGSADRPQVGPANLQPFFKYEHPYIYLNVPATFVVDPMGSIF